MPLCFIKNVESFSFRTFLCSSAKNKPKVFCLSGVIPNSDFLAESKLEVDSKKAVIVDEVTH